MKQLISIIIITLFVSCVKDSKETEIVCQYTTATITNNAPTCDGWGIIVNTTVYPSRNIPDNYKQNNLAVCVNYSLFNDLALCPCCGGIYANILSISK